MKFQIPLRTLYRWEQNRLSSKNCLENSENNHSNTNTEENEASTSNSVSSYSSDSSRSTDNESDQDKSNSNDCDESADDREDYDDGDENYINIQNDTDLDLDDITDETDLDDQGNHNIAETNTANDRNDDNGLIDDNNDVITVQYEKLHEDSPITVDECVFNLLNFYCKHNITKAALKESLEMQLKLLPENMRMPKTLFKLFQYAQSIAPRCKVIKHYYCKKCLYTVDVEVRNKKKIMTCPLCQTCKPIDISFFFLNLISTIK